MNHKKNNQKLNQRIVKRRTKISIDIFYKILDIEGLQEAIELLGDEKIRQLYEYCREEVDSIHSLILQNSTKVL